MIGDPYITTDEAAQYLGTGIHGDMAFLDQVVRSASAEIEAFCGRQFNRSADPSTRVYPVAHRTWVATDDFWTDEGLVVAADSGPIDDYRLEPRAGVVGGVPGWPYRRIVAPSWLSTTELTVTAMWGWESVPAPVRQACYVVAAETFKLKDAPLGVAGFGEFGVVRARDIPHVKRMLAPYRHPESVALVG